MNYGEQILQVFKDQRLSKDFMNYEQWQELKELETVEDFAFWLRAFLGEVTIVEDPECMVHIFLLELELTTDKEQCKAMWKSSDTVVSTLGVLPAMLTIYFFIKKPILRRKQRKLVAQAMQSKPEQPQVIKELTVVVEVLGKVVAEEFTPLKSRPKKSFTADFSIGSSGEEEPKSHFSLACPTVSPVHLQCSVKRNGTVVVTDNY